MEQIIKLTGRIAEVMPLQSGVSQRTGNQWKSQEYLFEYFAWGGAMYANRIVCRVFGEDKIARFNKEMAVFEKKWPQILRDGDPYYNPNLTLASQDFSLRRI